MTEPKSESGMTTPPETTTPTPDENLTPAEPPPFEFSTACIKLEPFNSQSETVMVTLAQSELSSPASEGAEKCSSVSENGELPETGQNKTVLPPLDENASKTTDIGNVSSEATIGLLSIKTEKNENSEQLSASNTETERTISPTVETDCVNMSAKVPSETGSVSGQSPVAQETTDSGEGTSEIVERAESAKSPEKIVERAESAKSPENGMGENENTATKSATDEIGRRESPNATENSQTESQAEIETGNLDMSAMDVDTTDEVPTVVTGADMTDELPPMPEGVVRKSPEAGENEKSSQSTDNVKAMDTTESTEPTEKTVSTPTMERVSPVAESTETENVTENQVSEKAETDQLMEFNIPKPKDGDETSDNDVVIDEFSTESSEKCEKWHSNIELKSNVLTKAWTDLYALLGEYKAELRSKDIAVQKYESISDVQQLKGRLVDKDEKIKTLEDEIEKLKDQNEQNQLDISVKDTLLKKYQNDLLQKESALVTATTKTARLENRLKMLETRAASELGEPARKLARTQFSPVRTPLPIVNRTQYSPAANRTMVSPNRAGMTANRGQFTQARGGVFPRGQPNFRGRTMVGRGPGMAGRIIQTNQPRRRLDNTLQQPVSMKPPPAPSLSAPAPTPDDQVVCIELNDDDDDVQVVREATEGVLENAGYVTEPVFPDRGDEYLSQPGTSTLDSGGQEYQSQEYPSQEYQSQEYAGSQQLATGGSQQTESSIWSSSSPVTTVAVPISRLAAAVLRSRGHMLLARSLKNSGPTLLTKSSCDLIRQAFQFLHMQGLGVANDSIFQKLHPNEVTEAMLEPFGVSASQYSEAYAKPLNRQAAVYFESLLMKGGANFKVPRPPPPQQQQQLQQQQQPQQPQQRSGMGLQHGDMSE